MIVVGLMPCSSLVRVHDATIYLLYTSRGNHIAIIGKYFYNDITGIGQEDATSLVKAAETCCTEDIYHFDDTERFFLVSCLALWYVVIL